MAQIVVIDDDSMTLRLVSIILESAGHTITQATDGEMGIMAALADPGPDLVVTDLNMRGISGWDVVRRIRGAGKNEIPILALSAFTSSRDRDEAFEAGCTAYVNKPIDKDKLIEKVSKLLS